MGALPRAGDVRLGEAHGTIVEPEEQLQGVFELLPAHGRAIGRADLVPQHPQGHRHILALP